MVRNTSTSAATMAVSSEPTDVDPAIWRAVAGASLYIPTVGSRVCYFPQGHFEQCISTTTNNSSASSIYSLSLPSPTSSSPPPSPSPSSFNFTPPPYFFCRVLSVRFLAHPNSEELFACLHLLPIPPPLVTEADVNTTISINNDDDNVDGDDDIVSSVKILTPSDANNGGGFSVPRYCADVVLPPLDFEADPPVQHLIIRDINGKPWGFKHIYRGTPRRHLFTTGWSKFVNTKRLVASDSVVFMRRRSTGELYAGVRRASRWTDVTEKWNYPVSSETIEESNDRQIGKGRVAAEVVLEAVEIAAKGMAFEVVCYPRPGWVEFVVKAEAVEESMSIIWTNGMKVKMAMETEDGSRTTLFQGTVSSATMPRNGPWKGSPWRMLQITWDEPDALEHVKRVNPWQVQSIIHEASSLSPPIYQPTKKLKTLPYGQLNRSFMNYNNTSFPSYEIQGARQKQQVYNNFNQIDYGIKSRVSTELNIGSSLTDTFSLDSQNSVHLNVTQKTSVGSFQLFGKIIHIQGENHNMMSKQIEEDDNHNHTNNALDLSLTYSYGDVHYSNASTGKTYF